jgi:TolA-binding protein
VRRPAKCCILGVATTLLSAAPLLIGGCANVSSLQRPVEAAPPGPDRPAARRMPPGTTLEPKATRFAGVEAPQDPAYAARAPASAAQPMPAVAPPAERRLETPALGRRFESAYRLIVRGQFRSAEGKLVELLGAYERGAVTEGRDEALFWLAHCREELGRTAEAAATYRDLLQRFPGSDYAPDARQRVRALSATRPAGGD